MSLAIAVGTLNQLWPHLTQFYYIWNNLLSKNGHMDRYKGLRLKHSSFGGAQFNLGHVVYYNDSFYYV